MSRSRAPDEERFRTVYDASYSDVLRFVQRRVHASHAEDVTAETFLVVWRRLDAVPELQSDARAWIFGVARNVLLSSHRAGARETDLAVQLRDDVRNRSFDLSDQRIASVETRIDVARAWRRLSAVHQEALALTTLDGLTASEAAVALGISPVAYRLRLSRARRALRAHLTHLPPTAAPSPATERPAPDAPSSH